MTLTRAICLGAASYAALSLATGSPANAQSPNVQAAPSANTTLSPIVVQENTARRARPTTAKPSARTRQAAGASARRGRGATAAAPAVAATAAKKPETAWGHVDGYVATRSGSGTKTDTPLIETPQAISVVTQDQIQAQAAQSIPQAVRYSSGVNVDQTGADARFNNIYIRGFLADQYLDAMKIVQGSFAASIIEPFDLERIEVLHGPASVLYGQATPGGIIDMVSKRPTATPTNEMFISTGSYGRIQGGLDTSGPIDKNGEFLYRLNVSGFDVGSQVDNTKYDRISIAPSLTWRPDNDTTITFQGTYQHDPKAGFFNELPPNGIGTITPTSHGFIPTNVYTGDPNFDKMDRTLSQGGYLLEHHLDNMLTVRQNLRYSNVDTDVANVSPSGALTANQTTLARSAYSAQETLQTFQLDNQIEGKFAFGPFQHTTLFGFDYLNGSDTIISRFGSVGVPSINVFAPVYGVAIPLQAINANRKQSIEQAGIYAQDQIKFGNWVALLGLRGDQASTRTDNYLTSSTSTQTDQALTKRGALLYKFDNGIAPYIQYTESFQPQIGADFAGNPFKPTTGQQKEVGIKYQPDAKSLYTLAVYNLTQQNVLTPDPVNGSTFSVQTGAIRSRGIELEGKTELTRSLSILASYTYIDMTTTVTNTATALGKRPVGIPGNTASGWADYTFHGGTLDGFGLAGGVRYLGSSAGNVANTYFVPSTTLFDAAVHYDLSGLDQKLKGLSLAVNATNLFDKVYVGWCQDAGCYYGLRRQVIATLRYKW